MNWIEILTKTMPIIIVIMAYFVHLEVRLTNMSNDLKWIKDQMKLCQRD